MKGLYLLIAVLFLHPIFAYSQVPGRIDERLVTYQGKEVECKVKGDLLVYQGDIVLGRSSQLSSGENIAATASRLWPDGIIPYEIDPRLPNPQRVLDSIRHWNENTIIKLVEHNREANWVRFVQFNNDEHAGFSAIGMVGGVQDIMLDDNNGPGIIIHEIGHAVGFWHEQSRFDRDDYIQINTRNIKQGFEGQFAINSFDSQDVGPYDFGSIMHYGISQFTKNGLLTIKTIPEGIPIGQQAALSPLDIDGVRRLYGRPSTSTIITTFPTGLNIEVDGISYTAPQQFSWTPGSRHEITVPEAQNLNGLFLNFARWSNNGSRTQTVIASGDGGAYAANFSRRVPLLFQSVPTEGGTVTFVNPSADGKYAEGSFVQVLAKPNPGFFFSHWEGLPAGITQGISANPATFLGFQNRIPLRAHFTTSPTTTIRTNLPDVPILVDGEEKIGQNSFTWEAGSTHTVEAPTSLFPDAGIDFRYIFLGWSNGGSPSQTITATGNAVELVANYKRQFLVSSIVILNLNPDLASQIPPPSTQPGRIKLSPAGEDSYFDEGQKVEAKLEIDPGFFFIAWSGTVQSKDKKLNFTVNGPQLIIANVFQKMRLSSAGVVNAADLKPGQVSPGQIVSIFGLNIGPKKPATMQAKPDGTIDTVLSNTRVLVDGAAVPILYASQSKVTAIIPFKVANLTTINIEVEYKGKRTNPQTITVARATPSLFNEGETSSDPIVVHNEDGSRNSPDNPASRGSVVTFTATGLGLTDPAVPEGKVNTDPLPKPILPIRIIIGGIEADLEFIGGVPGQAPGIIKIMARIPQTTTTGNRVQVLLSAGDIFSQTIGTFAIK